MDFEDMVDAEVGPPLTAVNAQLMDEVKKLRQEVAELRGLQEATLWATGGPIPGKRCTIHMNCRGGSEYCNDGGPITDFGIGW